MSSPPDSPEHKLLVVAYYWPPSGGSGVQRWLKFVKYLPSFGWTPYVFTPENPSVEGRDESLLEDVPKEAEVIHFPIWEPYSIFRKTSALVRKPVRQIDLVSTGKRGLFQSIATWVRGNILVPDPRIFWVRPSVQFLADFLRSNNIRTLITTGPPHSLHLIGLKLKKKDPSLRWIADLRDPWSEWDLLDTLSLTSLARRRHQKLEKEVLQAADEVITIGPYHVERFEKLGGRKVNLITNGFDEDDFSGIHREQTKVFTIRHIGMVDELRDPRPFMEALKGLLTETASLRDRVLVEFIGSVNSAFKSFVENDPLLNAITRFRDPMPHNELLKLYGSTDLQLLILAHTVLAPGNLPGKFFEYLASGNFILGLGPVEGDAAAILRQTRAGEMINRQNRDTLRDVLRRRIDQWSNGSTDEIRSVDTFSRKSLTKQLVSLLGK